MVGLLIGAKRTTKSAECIQSYQRVCGADLQRTFPKTTSFFRNSSMAAGDDREACRNLCLSTQTLAANMLSFMCTASGTRRMIPIVHVNPPRNGGKDAPGGGLWTTYAHATAHLRCSSPYHMPNNCPRLPFHALRLRIREFSGPNLTPAPAASRVC